MAHPPPEPSHLDTLRARIRAIEAPSGAQASIAGLGDPFDQALPWGGLPRGCIHEIVSGKAESRDRARNWADGGAATAFAAAMLRRLAGKDGKVMWCLAGDDLYPPGLGLAPANLIVVRANESKDLLWSLEEALRCPDLAAVLGEIGKLDLTAARRLQLAAEQSGTTGIILRHHDVSSNTATTRWRVSATPGENWEVALERCRGGGGRNGSGLWHLPARQVLV